MTLRYTFEKLLTIDEDGSPVVVRKTRAFEKIKNLDGTVEEIEKPASLSVVGGGHVSAISTPSFRY